MSEVNVEVPEIDADLISDSRVQALLAQIRGESSDGVEPSSSDTLLNQPADLATLIATSVQNSLQTQAVPSRTLIAMTKEQHTLKVSQSGQTKGTICPNDTAKFCTNLSHNAAKNQVSYSRTDHLSFVSSEAQSVIVAQVMESFPDEPTLDIFALPTAEFISSLKILFPKVNAQISTADLIRSLKNLFPHIWWKNKSHLIPFINQMVSAFDFLEDGKWKTGNGGVFSEQEWPNVLQSLCDLLHEDKNATKANLENATWLTHRRLVDRIMEYPPDNLHSFLKALMFLGKEFHDEYDNAQRCGWLLKSASNPTVPQISSGGGGGGGVIPRQGQPKTFPPANWTPCPKCNVIHNFKEKCKTGSSSSSSGSSSSATTSTTPSSNAPKRGGGGKWNDSKNKKPRGEYKINNIFEDQSNLAILPFNNIDNIVVKPNVSTLLNMAEVSVETQSDTLTLPRPDLTDKVHINVTPSDIDLINNIIQFNPSPASTVPMVIVSKYPSIESVLIDSGSLKSNYIDINLFDRLKAQGHPTKPLSTKRRVCSGLAGVEGQEIKESMDILVVFIDETLNKEKSIILTLHPVQLRADSSFKIIIGLPIIQRFRLASCFPSIFEGTTYNHMKYFTPLSKFISTENLSWNQGRDSLTSARLGLQEPIRHADHMPDLLRCAVTSSSTDSAPLEGRVDINNLDSHDSDEVHETLHTRFERAARDLFSVEPSDEVMSLESILELVQLSGPPTLQAKLIKLLDRFRHVFSLTVSPTPAVVDTPMEIQINTEQWEHKSNRQPPRLQSQLKEEELRKQVVGLLEAGVIRRSKASYWSQVHLTPKPDEKWRFCIDYRKLNATTYPTEGHPLPRIDHMLQRLGRRKAKYFGVIDLTAGYHQVPLAPEAIPLTAFICFMGLFEFLRVPFGLTNACSYFQRFIAVIVLAELMYTICEAYIDDVIVTGQEEDDFVSNVEAVLIKFDNHKIKVSPKKMKLGLTQIECVGHVVDKDGVHFSRSKLDSVLNFKRPEYAAQMKSFLGLANYFRDNVRGYSELSRPLNDMISRPYNRRNKLDWTSDTIAAYDALRQAIHECPKLFFLQDGTPIHLFTDASDYGIGAYLCQLIDGRWVPIAFISRTLDKGQRKWSTPEKECYAIYYSLVKLEHLLLDREFIIHTDHKNLTFLDESANARVNRWKLALQEYKFTLAYIKGEDNIVADAFSRLCLLSDSRHLSEEEVLSAFDEPIELMNNFATQRLSYPKEYAAVLGMFHNTEVGHFGVEKTMQKLLEKGHRWDYMRQHVKAFIRKCPCCQLMSQIKPAIHTLPFTVARYNPMESLNVDSIGPLPPDEDGNTFIIVVIDRFSRWVELYATRDATAKAAARSLLNQFGRYGTASELLSDGGSQYVNEIIEQVLLLIGSKHDITLAYSKEENSIVERCNKEVLRHLKNIIFEKRVISNWSIYLPLVQRILNSAIHSSLGVSPAQILFGNAIDLDRNLFPTAKEFSISFANLTLSQYATDLIAAQDIIIKIAQDHQSARDQKHLEMKEKYMQHEKFRLDQASKDEIQAQSKSPRKRKRAVAESDSSVPIQQQTPEITVFPVNSFVLVAYPDTGFTKRPRPPNKFMPDWRGPFQVISYVGASYNLLNLVTMKEESGVHVRRLKEFLYEEGTDPREIANKQADSWDVERIISHSGNLKDRNEMKFIVKWLGFEDTTEEPYSNRSLFKTAAMHKYLRDNKLVTLIPVAFR